MKLHEKQLQDGSSRSQRLDDLLVELEAIDPEARSLFVHLHDLHDGAARLERIVKELAELTAEDLSGIKQRLWDIRVELYDHLIPNHLEAMRPIIVGLCDRLADQLEPGDSEPGSGCTR